MVAMFGQAPRVDEDVIDIDQDESVQIPLTYPDEVIRAAKV